MNQLITITQNENNDQVVSGRELHEFLEVKTPYHIWFERMAEYGFTENVDFIGFEQKSSKLGGRPSVDHALKIDMAKEISMIQRNEKGKQARQYFIEVEKELKQQLLPQTPEQQIALLAQGNVNLNKKVEQIENSVLDLTDRFGLPSNKAKVLQKKVASKVYMFTGGKYSNAHKKLGAKVFREFYKDLNNRFDVVKYSDIPLSRYDEATEYLDMWQPSFNTTLEIRGLNSQTSFDFEVPPVTLGHEMSGVVNFIGEGVSGLKVGDHVVVEPYIVPEGTDTSETGHYNLAEGSNFIGLGGNGGGLAEKISVDERWVHKIPDNLPLDEAALIEPLSVGYHAVERANLSEKSTVLVVGAGPIGLLTAAVAKAQGHTVIISEPSGLRRKKAQEAQVADYFFNPIEDDIQAKVHEINEKGVDAAFECTSVQPGFDACLDAIRMGGTVVIVAIWGKPASVDMAKLVIKEANLLGTIAYNNTHPKTIDLVSTGKIKLDQFITAKIGLDDLIDKGFDTLIHHNETAVKILVSPTGKGL